MPEQKKQSVKMIITVALGPPPTINVDVQNELNINEEQPLTKYLLERVSEYISGKEATTNAITKAAQDTLTKRNIH
ncbi:hypothetical protein ISO66_16820 [Morganella morganii subsp. morganii]|uniref:hypothetical protein n=1 Tax=Morganella morganii TaxID=582 RepID=UPI001BDB56A6|nr:hypothetical protein [Morganella morganii]MBT0334984.1 hypothetical protein [Morganella morganii subsp. morganii]